MGNVHRKYRRCYSPFKFKGGDLMKSLVYKKERFYFVISLVISVLLYIILIFSIIYGIIGAIFGLIAHGLLIGNIRGNAVKVSERQFSDVYDIARNISNRMELRSMPDIYIVESGGILNAFATKFLGRHFAVIYSDVLELAYQEGESAVEFIISHELAHIKRGHLSWRLFLYPSMLIPFLGTAYSRACEYTCDRFAAHLKPQGSIDGLLVLAVGKKLYKKINVNELRNQSKEEKGFWVWFSEVLSTHPNLTKRVDAVASYVAVKNYSNSEM